MTPDEVNLIAKRARRETMRWLLLVTINLWRPTDAMVSSLRPVIVGVYPDATDMEILRELDYLVERDLLSMRTDPLGQSRVKMERYGMDIVEYTVDCEPGIARPQAGG